MANIWQCQELPFATDNFHIRLAFLSYSDSFNRNSNIWSTEFSTFGSWIYPQKLTHVRHLAIKILLNAKKKLCRIKIQVGHPIKTVLKIVSFSVGKWQIEMLLFHTWLHCYIVLNHANVILFHTMTKNDILSHSMTKNAILFHFVHFSIERLRGYFRLLRRISLLTNDILNQISRL